MRGRQAKKKAYYLVTLHGNLATLGASWVHSHSVITQNIALGYISALETNLDVQSSSADRN